MSVNEQDWASKDYYGVLGVDRDADEKTIKKAYRRLARKYHPDVNQDDSDAEDKFNAVAEAYEVLGDKDTRAKYDEFRSMMGNGYGAGFNGAPWGSNGYQYSFNGDDPQDFLHNLFNGSPYPGFEDLFNSRSGNGYGMHAHTGRTENLDLRASITLGFRTMIDGGTVTFTLEGQTIKTKVPRGLENGQTIRIPGKGLKQGDRTGDLLLEVYGPDTDGTWVRNGLNLERWLPLTFMEATLGGTISIKDWNGETIKVKIPKGCQNGKKLRVAGKGVKKGNGKHQKTGDLILETTIILPKNLTKEARETIEHLATLTPEYQRRVNEFRSNR